MCRRVTCPTCHKPTWAGCGAHVDQVLRDVPRDERCRCRDDARAGRSGSSAGKPVRTAAATAPAEPPKRTLLQRLGLR